MSNTPYDMSKCGSKIDEAGYKRVPVWMVVAVVASILPVLYWPVWMMQSDFGDGKVMLACLFPIYIVLSGYLAYKCYPVRKEISYVLLVLMWLSYGAVLLL